MQAEFDVNSDNQFNSGDQQVISDCKDRNILLPITGISCGCPDYNNDNVININDAEYLAGTFTSHIDFGQLKCSVSSIGYNIEDLPECNSGLDGSNDINIDDIQNSPQLDAGGNRQRQAKQSLIRDMSKFSDDNTYIVSDYDPYFVLMVNSFINWRWEGEDCNKIDYGIPKCSYPLLIYHEEVKDVQTEISWVDVPDLSYKFKNLDELDYSKITDEDGLNQEIIIDETTDASGISFFMQHPEPKSDSKLLLLIWSEDKKKYISTIITGTHPGISWGMPNGVWQRFDFGKQIRLEKGKYKLKMFKIGKNADWRWGRLMYTAPGSEKVPYRVISGNFGYLYSLTEKIRNTQFNNNEMSGEFKKVKYTRALDSDGISIFLKHYAEKKGRIKPVFVVDGNELHLPKTPHPLGTDISYEWGGIQYLTEDGLLNYINGDNPPVVVYVKRDYQKAILASQYASLINGILIVEGSNLDKDENYLGRNVVGIGFCKEGITCSKIIKDIGDIQQEIIGIIRDKYPKAGNNGEFVYPDKMILINPNDISDYYCELINYEPDDFKLPLGNGINEQVYQGILDRQIPPENYGFSSPQEINEWGKVNYGFCRDSLSAVQLATVKDEVIIFSGTSPGPGKYLYGKKGVLTHERIKETEEGIMNIAESIKDTINEESVNLFEPEFLTYVGSPISIPFSYSTGISINDPRKSLDIYYADNNDDQIPDKAIGRILGISVAADSSYVARAIYLSKEDVKRKKFLILEQLYPYVSVGWLSIADSLKKAGNDVSCFMSLDNIYLFYNNPEELPCTSLAFEYRDNIKSAYEKSDIIISDTHGNRNGCGIVGFTEQELLFSKDKVGFSNSGLYIGDSCLVSAYYVIVDPLDPEVCKTARCMDSELDRLFAPAVLKKGAIGIVASTDNLEVKDSPFTGVASSELMLRALLAKGEIYQGNIIKSKLEFAPKQFFGDYVLLGDPTVKIMVNKQDIPYYNLGHLIFNTYVFKDGIFSVSNVFNFNNNPKEIKPAKFLLKEYKTKLKPLNKILSEDEKVKCSNSMDSKTCEIFYPYKNPQLLWTTPLYETKDKNSVYYTYMIPTNSLGNVFNSEENSNIIYDEPENIGVLAEFKVGGKQVISDIKLASSFGSGDIRRSLSKKDSADAVLDSENILYFFIPNPREDDISFDAKLDVNGENILSPRGCEQYEKSMTCSYSIIPTETGKFEITGKLNINDVEKIKKFTLYVGRYDYITLLELYLYENDINDRAGFGNFKRSKSSAIGIFIKAIGGFKAVPGIIPNLFRINPDNSRTAVEDVISLDNCAIEKYDEAFNYHCLYKVGYLDVGKYEVEFNINPNIDGIKPFTKSRSVVVKDE